jgi:hypothetical protein
MTRKLALIAALALAVPALALAANPTHPSTPANSNGSSNANGTSTTGKSSSATPKPVKVIYVLRGTLTKYAAANGDTKGTITITVKSANRDMLTLKGMTLTFPVSSSTKVVLKDGKITDNHLGITKVRAVKHASAATLQTLTAFQVIDQGTDA